MKKFIGYALIIAASVLFADFVTAGTTGSYNRNGVSGAQVVVGTSVTPVLPFTNGRLFALICNQGTVTVYCETGPAFGGAPTPAPTTTGSNAQPIFPNTCLTLTANANTTPQGIGLIAQAELDCIAGTAAQNVSTLELP